MLGEKAMKDALKAQFDALAEHGVGSKDKPTLLPEPDLNGNRYFCPHRPSPKPEDLPIPSCLMFTKQWLLDSLIDLLREGKCTPDEAADRLKESES